jgi:hypothetical protein
VFADSLTVTKSSPVAADRSGTQADATDLGAR